MRKYNFILSADNVGIFIKRLDDIIAITGSAIKRGQYTGAKEIDGYLKSQGLKKLFYPNPVVYTSPAYILHHKVKFRPENNQKMLYIHVNSDCVLSIPYGSKIFMAPGIIKYKSVNKWGRYCNNNPQGLQCTITSYANAPKAIYHTEIMEQQAADYWKMVEEEWNDQP